MKKNYYAITTPDLEEELEDLKNEFSLAPDEEREEELEREIEEIENILEERKALEEEDEIEELCY